MKITDHGVQVEVASEGCQKLECYWPKRCRYRLIPGRSWEYWCCGTRETIGCPDDQRKAEERP